MKEKNIINPELEREFQELKKEWLEEVKIVLATEYPRREGQLDGEDTLQLAKIQKKYKEKIKKLKEKYK